MSWWRVFFLVFFWVFFFLFYGFALDINVSRPSIFLFLDDNLSKCQWIFAKLGTSTDMVELWFGITNEQISSFLTEISVYFQFWTTWVNINEFLPNLVCAPILWRSDLGLPMGKFRQFLKALSASHTTVAGYHFTFLFFISIGSRWLQKYKCLEAWQMP